MGTAKKRPSRGMLIPGDSCKNIESFERNLMEEVVIIWGSPATVKLVVVVAKSYRPKQALVRF
jgi:hypothetical protein